MESPDFDHLALDCYMTYFSRTHWLKSMTESVPAFHLLDILILMRSATLHTAATSSGTTRATAFGRGTSRLVSAVKDLKLHDHPTGC